MAAAGAAQILWGQRLSPGAGLGWDGRFYSHIARDLPHAVFEEGLDAYRLQRVVTPALVYLGVRVLGVPPTDGNLVDAFAVYNLLLLLASVVVWRGMAREAALGERSLWLGFLLLFVNFANLKMPYFYPVLTDTTAFFLGALLVYFHLRDSSAGMLCVMAVGAFAWPSFAVLGGLLYLFPRRSLGPPEAASRPWPLWVGAAGAAAFLVHLLLTLPDVHAPRPSAVRPPSLDRLWLSVPFTMGYVAVVAAGLLGHAGVFRTRNWRVPPRRLAAWLALLAASSAAVRLLARGDPPLDFEGFVWQITHQSIIEPGLPLVAAAVYLGVVALLATVCWRRLCRAAHGLGLGMTLFLGAVLAQNLTTEPRQILHGLAALTLAAVLAVDDVRWPAWGRWLVAGLALLGSKVWFDINREGFSGKDKIWTYPSQYYFMNHGPWMQPETFQAQGLVALGAGLLLLVVMRRSLPVVPGEGEGPLLSLLAGRRVAAAAAGVAGVLAISALVEGAARLALRPPDRESEGSVPHAALGWANRPGARLSVGADGGAVEVAFDSRGLRGPERSYAKTAPRVLLLGDGFVEAYNVAEEDSIRAVLESRLRREGCAAEVLNGGAAGFSTDQAYLFHLTEGRQYRPDVVALFFYSNDLYHNLRGRPGKPRPVLEDGRLVVRKEGEGEPALGGLRPGELDTTPRHRFRGSAFLRLLSNATLEHAPAAHRWLGRRGAVDWGPPPPELWPYGPREENKEMWAMAAAILRELAQVVEAGGGRLLLVYVPARFEIEEGAWEELGRRYRMSDRFWRPQRVAGRLGAVAEELGLPLVDPRPALRRAAGRGRPAYHRDGLWSAEGHRAAAEALLAPTAGRLGCPQPARAAAAAAQP